MSKILLLGSTGMIGTRIATEARARGHDVTEVTRSRGDGRVNVDAADTDALSDVMSGHDAVISAISPPRDGTEPAPPLVETGRSIIDAARRADVERILVVGGAGSLLLDDGTRVVDQAGFPEDVKPEALAHVQLLDRWRSDADDLAWSYLSPAGQIAPGQRTGTFTLGTDQLVTNADGSSEISAEDYAVAVIDEIERPRHIRRRFTLGYTD